jgi:hypothetical protein
MHMTGRTEITPISEWSQRVEHHPEFENVAAFVTIRLNRTGDRLYIETAYEADELIEWATAAKGYLKHGGLVALPEPEARPEPRQALVCDCGHTANLHDAEPAGCRAIGCKCCAGWHVTA